MTNYRLCAFTLLSFISLSTSAKPNNCEYLEIYVHNKTNRTCYLTDYHLIRGFYTDDGGDLPIAVSPGQHALVTKLWQGVVGSGIIMTYECGSNTSLTVESQQNTCLFYAPDPKGHIVDYFNLLAYSYVKSGSAFKSRSGQIHWTIGT